jgi:hypothetical protein
MIKNVEDKILIANSIKNIDLETLPSPTMNGRRSTRKPEHG